MNKEMNEEMNHEMNHEMKREFAKWKEQLLDAALMDSMPGGLAEHVSKCLDCAEALHALRERRARMDRLLPLVASAAEPSVDFRARVMAAAEAASGAKRSSPWRVWGLAGVTAVIAATIILSITLPRRAVKPVPDNELAAAEKLSQWRAPSDTLLQAPMPDLLHATPKLGESYLQMPVKADREE